LGLVLLVYFDGDAAYQLTPPSVTIPRAKLDWCAAHDRIDDLWYPWDPPEVCGEELRRPDVHDNAELTALLAEINDGYDAGLLEDYFAALALSLHESLGVLVVVDGWNSLVVAPEREQLRPQMSDEQWAEWRPTIGCHATGHPRGCWRRWTSSYRPASISTAWPRCTCATARCMGMPG
jgi:hypothetical protein